jgi:hypothetical protein
MSGEFGFNSNGSGSISIVYNSFANFPAIGNPDLIYFAKDTLALYYWNGFVYVPVSIASGLPSGALTHDITSGTGWNATTNNPAITSGAGSAGDFAIVAVAGATNIDGISLWEIGDYIWFDADNSVWRKIDNQSPQVIEREINFYDTQQVLIKPTENESFVSQVLSSHITTLEYSINNGVAWANTSYPINVNKASEILFRVKTYAGGNSFGQVVLISNLA